MDQEMLAVERATEMTPVERRPPPAPTVAEPALVDPAEHNIVFTSLVTGDQDVVGLVAYSIYKQNKYDWLMAFSRDQGRMPNDAEAQSYLLGESTTRRLATYRHLAEATLEGRGIEVPGAAPASVPHAKTVAGRVEAAPDGSRLQRIVLVSIIGVILAVLALLWLLHGGTSTPK